MPTNFNKNLSYIRKQKKLTQGELANKIGVDQSTISLWEKGMDLTVENAIKVAEALEVPIPDFLGRDLTKDNEYTHYDELDILYSKAKQHLSDDDIENIKFIYNKTIKNYEESKNKNNND